MKQISIFAEENRLQKLSELGDCLERLNVVDLTDEQKRIIAASPKSAAVSSTSLALWLYLCTAWPSALSESSEPLSISGWQTWHTIFVAMPFWNERRLPWDNYALLREKPANSGPPHPENHMKSEFGMRFAALFSSCSRWIAKIILGN